MPGKHPNTLQVESFLLQFCPGSTPIRYNLTRQLTPALLDYGSLVQRVTGPKGTERRFPAHNGERCSFQFMYSKTLILQL